MDGMTLDSGAVARVLVFIDHFKAMPDPRQGGKVMYPLGDVLLVARLAVLAGAEFFVDIARFGCMKRGRLRRLRPFLDGTPSHDHLGDIFAALDAGQFQRCFVAWTASLIGVPKGVVAIDGKTARRSGGEAGKAAIHMASAFVASQRRVRRQVKIAEKSNKTVAIVRKTLDKRADYVFGLNSNRGSLREDVEWFVTEQRAKDFADTMISRAETIEANNGRTRPGQPPSFMTLTGWENATAGLHQTPS